MKSMVEDKPYSERQHMVDELVTGVCLAFSTWAETIPDAEARVETFTGAFPPEITIDFLIGAGDVIKHFMSPYAPFEVQMFSTLLSSALARDIASGKVKVDLGDRT